MFLPFSIVLIVSQLILCSAAPEREAGKSLLVGNSTSTFQEIYYASVALTSEAPTPTDPWNFTFHRPKCEPANATAVVPEMSIDDFPDPHQDPSILYVSNILGLAKGLAHNRGKLTGKLPWKKKSRKTPQPDRADYEGPDDYRCQMMTKKGLLGFESCVPTQCRSADNPAHCYFNLITRRCKRGGDWSPSGCSLCTCYKS